MLWHKVQGAGGLVGGDPVTYAGLSGSVTSGLMNVPATTADQMLVLVTRTNSTTPAATLSGFTSALVASNSSANRSVRVQYRTGVNSAEQIDNPTAQAHIVLNNATSVGATNTLSQSNVDPTVPYPDLVLSKTDGTSFVFASTYVPWRITEESGSLTAIPGVGAYLEYNTLNISSGTLLHNSNIYSLSFTVEFV